MGCWTCRFRRWRGDIEDVIRWWWQRTFRGYADIEVWCFPEHLAKWALPRLRHLQQYGCGICIGETEEEDAETLATIIYALDLKVRYEFGEYDDLTEEEHKDMSDPEGRYCEGLRLFGEHWTALWD